MKVPMTVGHVGGYAAGFMLSWLVFPIEAVLFYIALEVTATATDDGMGGPLALPVMVVLAVIPGAAATVLVNLPAVVIGDLVGRRTRWWAGLVAAVVSAMAILAASAWALQLVAHTAPSDTAIVWAVAAGLVLLPLLVFAGCAYWSGALLALITRSRRQPKS